MINLKSYTLKEVSKKINVPIGTLRQWEKELDGVLVIPRSKQGARIFTDLEINLLLEINKLYIQRVNIDKIRDLIQKQLEPEIEISQEESTVSLEVVSETIAAVQNEEIALKNADLFFEAMDTYKKSFLSEVKDEIRSVVRKEVLDEVKKEISKGTLLTVKSLSDSIYKSTANTKAEIQDLSEAIEKASEHTTESLQYLSNSIANVTTETVEEFFTLSKQLSETTEELSHYVDVTNNEINCLTEVIAKDREFFVEERDHYRHEIKQREVAFQTMLSGFRDVAAAKDKKWWKFWS